MEFGAMKQSILLSKSHNFPLIVPPNNPTPKGSGLKVISLTLKQRNWVWLNSTSVL